MPAISGLSRAIHVLEQQADNRLIRLFPIRVESPYRYFFVCRPRALQTRSVRIFRDWLVAAEI